MRRSERAAAVAVVIVTLPGWLAFVALPVWAVAAAWPTMTGIDRGLFMGSCATFALTVRPVLGKRLVALFGGTPEGLTLFEQVLLGAPLVFGWLAVAHNWGALAFVGVCKAVEWRIKLGEFFGDRPPRPAVRVLSDRIEPRLTLASVVGPRIPRRWRDHWRHVAWHWDPSPYAEVRYNAPPDPADADP